VAIGNKFAGIDCSTSEQHHRRLGSGGAEYGLGDRVGTWDQLPDQGFDGNVVQGNYIGVDVSGSIAFANDNGIAVEYLGLGLGGPSNTKIGGAGAGVQRHLWNKYFGISLSNGANGNTIQGNLIGTNMAGIAKVPNGNADNTSGGGISLFMGSGDLIGGTVTGARNIISGNHGYGVRLAGDSSSEFVQGNFIGVDVNGAALGIVGPASMSLAGKIMA
jgi:titin